MVIIEIIEILMLDKPLSESSRFRDVTDCLVAILGVGCLNDHFFELPWES